jgi:hypothetical protein
MAKSPFRNFDLDKVQDVEPTAIYTRTGSGMRRAVKTPVVVDLTKPIKKSDLGRALLQAAYKTATLDRAELKRVQDAITRDAHNLLLRSPCTVGNLFQWAQEKTWRGKSAYLNNIFAHKLPRCVVDASVPAAFGAVGNIDVMLPMHDAAAVQLREIESANIIKKQADRIRKLEAMVRQQADRIREFEAKQNQHSANSSCAWQEQRERDAQKAAAPSDRKTKGEHE